MKRRPYDLVKRAIDILIAGLALILSLPIQLVVALLVRINLGSPVLFTQQRPGRSGRMFTMYKFRTMRDITEDLVSDEDRITPFGSWLRSTSLDELPELLNVLKGDMSIVGPRPLLPEYLPLYTARQARRHEVRPGISGWAQCHGRNAISWKQKFAYDVWYVDNISLWTDIRIIWKTIISVVQRDGISAENNVTIDDFNGYN